MRSTPAITLGVTGQELALRVAQGRPTAATFEVFRNFATDDGTPEFSGSASVDAVNTTVSAASGPLETDTQKLSLASTAGIVRERSYLLSENSIEELVEPIEVQPTYIRVRYPLKNSFTTAATLVSTWIAAVVDPTFVADVANLSDLSDLPADYRVRWEITVGGATVVAYSFFDLVRAPLETSVVIEDVNERAPTLATTLPTEYQGDSGRPLISAAWRAVRAHLVANAIDPQSIRDDEVIDELVILRSLRLLAEGGWKPPAFTLEKYLEVTTDNYDRFFEQHFAVVTRHRQDEAAVTTDATPRAFWRK